MGPAAADLTDPDLRAAARSPPGTSRPASPPRRLHTTSDTPPSHAQVTGLKGPKAMMEALEEDGDQGVPEWVIRSGPRETIYFDPQQVGWAGGRACAFHVSAWFARTKAPLPPPCVRRLNLIVSPLPRRARSRRRS